MVEGRAGSTQLCPTYYLPLTVDYFLKMENGFASVSPVAENTLSSVAEGSKCKCISVCVEVGIPWATFLCHK